jgi:hypothetical protein
LSARLIILAFICGGCGFLGEQAFSGQRVADVAPWQDIGPLTVCDGTLSLVGPMASPAGFCGAAPAKTCARDSDCKSRERCLCGACALGYCDSTADCQPGFVCTGSTHRCDRSCMKDGDCKPHESCVPGRNICSGSCSNDDDCQNGERCNPASSTCLSVYCSSDADCMGASCALQRQPESLAEPAPLAEKGGVTLWLERSGNIVRARSTDGLAFTLDSSAPPLAGRAPAVTPTDTGYLMLFAVGPDLFRAFSKDGVSWSADAAPAIVAAGAPSLIRLADGSYSAYVDLGGAVGRATSPDGTSFSTPEVVLLPDALVDPTLWRGVDEIASPFVQALSDVSHQPFVRLWFAARGQESAPAYNFGQVQEVPPNFSIGEAASSDGVTFTPYPYNPVFDRVVMFLDHQSELEPAIATVGSTQLLYYRRASADTSLDEGLAVARSPQQPR